LRTVTSYLHLLENRYGDRLDEEGRSFVEQATDGVERMAQMIESLLAYARVRTRGNPLRPVDAGAVVDDVLSDLALQARETGAEIEVGDLPAVAADRDQLAQVFRNLLSNALKYSGEEPPRVRVDASREGGRWRFSVRDEGVGIPPEETDEVFEVFHRAGDEGEGTGIGLALCEQIVDRHGGEIWVDSEPGEGSTFFFTVPAADAREPPELEPGDRAARGKPSSA
jgi:signal transduction histidine kinase